MNSRTRLPVFWLLDCILPHFRAEFNSVVLGLGDTLRIFCGTWKKKSHARHHPEPISSESLGEFRASNLMFWGSFYSIKEKKKSKMSIQHEKRQSFSQQLLPVWFPRSTLIYWLNKPYCFSFRFDFSPKLHIPWGHGVFTVSSHLGFSAWSPSSRKAFQLISRVMNTADGQVSSDSESLSSRQVDETFLCLTWPEKFFKRLCLWIVELLDHVGDFHACEVSFAFTTWKHGILCLKSSNNEN